MYKHDDGEEVVDDDDDGGGDDDEAAAAAATADDDDDDDGAVVVDEDRYGTISKRRGKDKKVLSFDEERWCSNLFTWKTNTFGRVEMESCFVAA